MINGHLECPGAKKTSSSSSSSTLDAKADEGLMVTSFAGSSGELASSSVLYYGSITDRKRGSDGAVFDALGESGSLPGVVEAMNCS